ALRAKLELAESQIVFIFVGRFVEKKGIQIVRHLAVRFPDITWLLVGWGPEDPARWHLKNVRVVGKRTSPDIAELYQAADLLVLPSVGEGFPLVVQESMSCGTPVAISTETAAAYTG